MRFDLRPIAFRCATFD
jgi:cold-inducible RNA-binding protein